MDHKKLNDAAFLARWYQYLFLLLIPTIIGNVLSDGDLVAELPAIEYLGLAVSLGVVLIRAGLLFKLKEYSAKLKIAALLMIVVNVGTLIGARSLLDFSEGITTGIMVVIAVGAVSSLLVDYFEFNGHSELMAGFDEDWSNKWKSLWNWEAISLGGIVAVIVLAALGFFNMFGIFIIMGLALLLLRVVIWRWTYLYRTKKFFEEYEVIAEEGSV